MNDNNNNLNNQRVDLNVPISTILKVAGVVLIAWFLYYIKGILLLLFISVFVAALVNNGVKYFQKYIKSRVIAVLLLYAIVVLVLGAVFAILIPILIDQIGELHNNWPAYTASILNLAPAAWHDTLAEVLRLDSIDWQSTVGDMLVTLSGVFSGIFNLIVVFALSFYMSLEEKAWDKAVDFFLPQKSYQRLMRIFDKIEVQLSQWFQAQITLSVIMSLLSYIGLAVLGVKYALVVALLAFIGEFVPYLGPILSTFFAVLFASLQSPLLAMIALVWFIIINQVENHILVPNIMRKAVGLNPIITIVALLVGVEIAGIAGALLAIPVATIAGVVINDFYESK